MGEGEITMYCDGSSLGNPGAGGWGVVIVGQDRAVELGGGVPDVTNNQMELEAAISGLAHLAGWSGNVQSIVICTDSKYVIDGITSWIFSWEKKGWINAAKKPVLNRDRWERLRQLTRNAQPTLRWQHVRGHSGVPGNERADTIARTFAAGGDPGLFSGARGEYPEL